MLFIYLVVKLLLLFLLFILANVTLTCHANVADMSRLHGGSLLAVYRYVTVK